MDPQQLDLAPPKNWQDFEDLCQELWQREWNCLAIQKHGRSGQDQKGVDIYGKPDGDSRYHGIQCKLKSRQGSKDSRLTHDEIMREVSAADSFEPPLAELIIATTAPSDARIQKFARELSVKRVKQRVFAVEVLAWQEIVLRLAKYPDLIGRFWPSRTVGPKLDLVLVETENPSVLPKLLPVSTELRRRVDAETARMGLQSLDWVADILRQYEVKALTAGDEVPDTALERYALELEDWYEGVLMETIRRRRRASSAGVD
jgi:hypothetical protein